MNLRNCSSVLFSSLLFFSSYIYLYVRISFPTSSPWLFSSPLFCSSFAIDASGRTSGRCAGVLLFYVCYEEREFKDTDWSMSVLQGKFERINFPLPHKHTHTFMKISSLAFSSSYTSFSSWYFDGIKSSVFLFTISLHLFFNTLYI